MNSLTPIVVTRRDLQEARAHCYGVRWLSGLATAAALATAMHIVTAAESCEIACATMAAPVLTNPGTQSDPVTQEYGYAAAVLGSQPIGYWRLEDYTGSAATDWSVMPHHGAISGGVSRGQAGALADGSVAMRLDGESTTRVDIADEVAFRLTAAVTVEVWTKADQPYATGALFDKTAGGSRAYLLMQEGDMWRWRVVGTFDTVNVWTPVTAGDMGAWVHLVGTFDGTTTRLYKNGVLMASHAASGTLTPDAGVARIGQLGGGGYAFPGMLDEIAVYGSALSAGQIAYHYALRTSASAVSLQLTASDPENDALTYRATGLPPGLLMHPTGGLITGNPTVPGTYSVTATVRDVGGLESSQTFEWTITSTPAVNPNRPVVTNPGNQLSELTEEYGYAAAVLAANPVGYWRLDDPEGPTVTDWTASHHGTAVGGIVRSVTGALADGSLAMQFDGELTTRIDIADDAAFRLTEAVTLEAWAKTAQSYATGLIFQKAHGGSNALSYLLMQEGDFWRWRVTGTFGTIDRWTAVTAGDVGTWVHLVGTFDGTTTRLYKNGVLMQSHAAFGSLTTGAGVTRIGLLGSDAYAFTGSLDEVAVYDTALTPGQIAFHYMLRNSTSTVSLAIEATEPDDDALTFGASGLPPGLLINPVTGAITGNPTSPGVYTVTVTARDPGGLAASQTFDWFILEQTAVNPNRPLLTNPGDQSSPVTSGYGYPAAVLAAGPTAYWRLDDGTATVLDRAGNVHHGTIHGGIAAGQSGALGEGNASMHFDGEPTTRIDVADDSAFQIEAAVTVELWAKTEDINSNGALFEKTVGGNTTPTYRLMQEAGYWVWRVVGTFGSVNRATPVTPQDVGAWVHLVGTFDGTTTRLYKNGVLMTSTDAEGTLTAGEGVTRIGLLGYDAYPFLGWIDDVAVYAAALSDPNIADHYARRSAPSAVSLQLTATDPDGDSLTYSATGLPPGLSINSATGLIAGNPEEPGTYSVTVTVRDSGGLQASQTFDWTLAPPTIAVNLTSPHPATVFSGPATVQAAASATASAGAIAQVEFFSGVESIGIDTVAPFQIHWTNVPVGEYTLIAIATGTFGGAAISNAVGFTVTDGGSTSGTLGVPLVLPAPGTYLAPLTVTLTAADGATIRYTTDGSEPTTSSSSYSAPIQLTTSTVVSAKAFQGGWTSSPTFSGSYNVGTAPTISASRNPQADANGWNTTNVTVTYTCGGPGTVVCPSPVMVVGEGIRDLTREAVNEFGRTPLTITTRIDKSAPALSISAPTQNAIVPAGALVIRGVAYDAGIGLNAVTCDVTAATVVGSDFTCEVTVPTAGGTFAIAATDALGNTRSLDLTVETPTNVSVEPTSLRITPGTLRMAVGETRQISVRDNLNRAAVDATWAVEPSGIVTVSTGGTHTLAGLSAGEATITATWRGLSASIGVTITATASLAAGEVMWSTPAASGATVSQIVPTVTLNGEPLNYVVESTGAGDFNPILRAVHEDGREEWTQAVGGRVIQLSADPLGSAVASVELFSGGVVLKGFRSDGQTFERTGGATFAIHPDGPLYQVESDGGSGAALAGVDIGMGAGQRAALPLGTWTVCTGGTIAAPTGCSSGSAAFAAGTPTVLSDGSVTVPIATSHVTQLVLAGVPDQFSVTPSLTVFRLAPDGTSAVTTIPVLGTTTSPNFVDIQPFKAIPNGRGGLIVGWNSIRTGDSGVQYGAHAAGIDASGAALPGSTGVGSWWGDLVLQENNALAVAYGSNFDGKRWQTLLTLDAEPASFGIQTSSEFTSAIATSNNGLIISYADGTMEGPDPDYQQMQLSFAQPLSGGGWIGGRPQYVVGAAGRDPARGESEWQTGGGGLLGQANAALRPRQGIWVKGHIVAQGYKHLSIRITPRNSRKWPVARQDLFVPRDNAGNAFATIGVESVGSVNFCAGHLRSFWNRPADINLLPASDNEIRPLFYASAREDELIGRLITLNTNFQNNPQNQAIEYFCWPQTPPQYNSNGFVRGLLEAAEISLPSFPQGQPAYAGFEKPVPRERFNPGQ